MTRPTLIDCDPGTDDAVALWLALASPAEIDLQLVTVVGGNLGLDATLANARAVLGLAGARLPVVAGADRPLLGAFQDAAHVHGETGLAGVRLPPGKPAAPGLAMDSLRDCLRSAPAGSVTLVGLGPATNLGLVLAAEPALAENVREIVLMTGAWGEGNITPSAEFNAFNDPEALAVVLACGQPITIAALDLTNQALVTSDRIRNLRAAGGGECLRAVAAIWDNMPASARSGFAGHELHDPCAIAWLVAPSLFTSRPVHVEMDLGPGPSRGRTVIDRFGRSGEKANVRLLESLDADGFFAMLETRLAALP